MKNKLLALKLLKQKIQDPSLTFPQKVTFPLNVNINCGIFVLSLILYK